MTRIFVAALTLAVMTANQRAVSADSHTRYVVDQVVIIVRDQPLGLGEVIHRLVTGDVMTLTGQSNDDYVEVDLPSGVRGWVDNRYITATPIARVELERALQQSRAEQAETEASLVQLSDDYARLGEVLDELRSSAGQPHGFEEEIDQLKQEVAEAIEEAGRLDRKNKELLESEQWQWYLSGAGTLAIGIVIGLAISRRRRRSNWDSL